jgi:hypothetical protein
MKVPNFKNKLTMREFKKIFGCKEIYDIDGVPIEVEISERLKEFTNGYDKRVMCYTNNLHQLQRQNLRLIGCDDAINLKVKFCDFYLKAFPEKKVNYRYWRAHLKRVGTALVYCNQNMTPEEIKYSLLRLLQRNVDIPKGLPIGEFFRIGIELDEIVEHCIMTAPNDKEIKQTNKILFNPHKHFTGNERRLITAKLARKKNAKRKVITPNFKAA